MVKGSLRLAATFGTLGVLAFVLADLLIRGDHRSERCDALGVGCARVHAYLGLAAAGWALLLLALVSVVLGALRRLRR
jgi:hypothetical protein